MEARLDSPAFESQDIGDLLVRQALEIPQEHNGSMFRGEQLELCLHKRPTLFLFHRLVRIASGGCLGPLFDLRTRQALLLAHAAPKMIETMIDGNTVKLGREARGATKVVQ